MYIYLYSFMYVRVYVYMCCIYVHIRIFHICTLYIYIYTYIYISEVGGLVRQAPRNRKSFRVVPCMRTCVRAVLGLARFQPNRGSFPFPFPLDRADFSLFPSIAPTFSFSLVQAYVPFSIVSTMKKWIQMKSSELI